MEPELNLYTGSATLLRIVHCHKMYVPWAAPLAPLPAADWGDGGAPPGIIKMIMI